MTEQERKDVIDRIWSSSSINIDYLKKNERRGTEKTVQGDGSVNEIYRY